MKKTVHRYMREDYFLSSKDPFYTRELIERLQAGGSFFFSNISHI